MARGDSNFLGRECGKHRLMSAIALEPPRARAVAVRRGIGRVGLFLLVLAQEGVPYTVATLGTALLSATGAFVLSVPGAERSPWHRVVPLVADRDGHEFVPAALAAGAGASTGPPAAGTGTASIVEPAAVMVVRIR